MQTEIPIVQIGETQFSATDNAPTPVFRAYAPDDLFPRAIVSSFLLATGKAEL